MTLRRTRSLNPAKGGEHVLEAELFYRVLNLSLAVSPVPETWLSRGRDSLVVLGLHPNKSHSNAPGARDSIFKFFVTISRYTASKCSNMCILFGASERKEKALTKGRHKERAGDVR